jgi:excisionase family DNA binding protein
MCPVGTHADPRSQAGREDAVSDLLTIREAARSLGVSTRTIHRLVRDAELAPVRIRGSVRFRPQDIEAYILRAQRQEPTAA